MASNPWVSSGEVPLHLLKVQGLELHWFYFFPFGDQWCSRAPTASRCTTTWEGWCSESTTVCALVSCCSWTGRACRSCSSGHNPQVSGGYCLACLPLLHHLASQQTACICSFCSLIASHRSKERERERVEMYSLKRKSQFITFY